MNNTFLLIACLISMQSFSQTYTGGSGTSVDPYQISNKSDLKYLSEHSTDWNKYYVQTADIYFLDSDFMIGGDFHNSGYGFLMIGNIAIDYFSGNYNGGNHLIDNLQIIRPGQNHVGFFGSTYGATISNIHLTNVSITGAACTGGLAGRTYNSTISNVSCTGIVGASGTVTGSGGIVGQAMNGSISNSHTNCTVSGYTYVGGLVGNGYGSVISDSYSEGEVIGDNTIGGFVGENSGKIFRCYAQASVVGNSSIGGFVGWNSQDTISDCYATGNIDGYSRTGGFAGTLQNGSFRHCYAAGAIGGVNDAGGFTGYVYTGPQITNSYWNTETSGLSTTSGGGTGITTASMQNQLTFTNTQWDFTGETTNGSNDIWKMSICNYGYPILSWQAIVPYPTVLGVSDGHACYNTETTLTATVNNGSSVSWYTQSTGGTAIATGSNYTTDTLTTDVTFYITIDSAGCVNPNRVPIHAFVIPQITSTANVTDSSVCYNTEATLSASSPESTSIQWFAESTGGLPIASGNTYSTGVLTESLTLYVSVDSLGCANPNRIPVTATVIPQVTSSASVTNSSVCYNTEAMLNASSPVATTIHWFQESTGGNPIASGAEVLTGLLTENDTLYVALDSAGCMSPVRVPAIAFVNPEVIATTTVSGITITATTPNATFQWINCTDNSAIPGETNITFTPSANGNYAVIAIQNDCSDTSECVAITSVGLHENTSSDVTVFPVPSQGNFTIDFGKVTGDITMTVKNEWGQIILTKNYMDTNLIQENLEGPKGVYFIELLTGSGTHTVLKVIKQ